VATVNDPSTVQVVIRADTRPLRLALLRAERAFLHLELAVGPRRLRRVVLRYRIWRLRHV
jgi:hypothetical protein